MAVRGHRRPYLADRRTESGRREQGRNEGGSDPGNSAATGSAVCPTSALSVAPELFSCLKVWTPRSPRRQEAALAAGGRRASRARDQHWHAGMNIIRATSESGLSPRHRGFRPRPVGPEPHSLFMVVVEGVGPLPGQVGASGPLCGLAWAPRGAVGTGPTSLCPGAVQDQAC